MASYDIFEMLCKEKGVKPNRVSIETGIATATLSNWKNGRYAPKKDKIQKIADYFDVPLDYFYPEEKSNLKSDLQITPYEANIIRKYRQLDGFGRQMVDTVLDTALAQVMEEYSDGDGETEKQA